MMKIIALILLFSASAGYAQLQDPRAVTITKQHGTEAKGKPGYRREESAYSIVIYGANDRVGEYRILGVDRPMKLAELTELLGTFYRDFPRDAVTADKRSSAPVPFPNILYASGGWNEMKNDGRDLVTKASKEHGVALYYFQINAGYEISVKPVDALLGYESACIDYYQQSLKKAAEVIQNPVKPAAEGKR